MHHHAWNRKSKPQAPALTPARRLGFLPDRPIVMAGTLLLILSVAGLKAAAPEAVTHSFLATGAQTQIVGASGHILWSYPANTRDGWVLPNGNILLAMSASKEFPGGGVIEVTRAGKRVFEWKGTQSEVNTVQSLSRNRLLVSEAGHKPRILEIDREGTIHLEVPMQCQTTNIHMESRMARKLRNGNYLVPQLLDKVVREYTPSGKIAWEVSTPHWPFTAIRLSNGNTLINCTYGNLSIEVDKKGSKVWELSNADLKQPLIKDACGAQRLPNGNTVITSYGAKAGETKLIEVTPEKKVVWTFTSPSPQGIHHFQILDTGGKALRWPPMR